MSQMWKGPCAELTESFSDPLASRLHRRAGRMFIIYTAAHDGRSAEVSRLQNRGDSYSLIPLGTVKGGDVMNLWLNIALQYTPFDAELADIMSAAVLRRLDQVKTEVADFLHRTHTRLNDLGQVLTNVRA